jgi:hypothetical protein
MRTTTVSGTAGQRTPTSRLAGLVRMLVRRPRRGTTKSSQQAGQPTERRIRVEVAPGVWRPIHIPDHAARRTRRGT